MWPLFLLVTRDFSRALAPKCGIRYNLVSIGPDTLKDPRKDLPPPPPASNEWTAAGSEYLHHVHCSSHERQGDAAGLRGVQSAGSTIETTPALPCPALRPDRPPPTGAPHDCHRTGPRQSHVHSSILPAFTARTTSVKCRNKCTSIDVHLPFLNF